MKNLLLIVAFCSISNCVVISCGGRIALSLLSTATHNLSLWTSCVKSLIWYINYRSPAVVIVPEVPAFILILFFVGLVRRERYFLLIGRLPRQGGVVPGGEGVHVNYIPFRKYFVVNIRRERIPSKPEPHMTINCTL